MHQIQLGTIDYAILIVYFGFVLGIGWCPAPIRPKQRGLLPLGPVHSHLDRRTRLPLRQPGRPGSDRHGGLGRQVRDDDEPFLLGRRHPRHGVRRDLHDAVLLRLPRALRAGIPPAPVRREDPGLQRDHLRRHDGVLLGHLDVRPGEAPRAGARVELPHQRAAVRRDRADLHLPRWTHLRDLQRGAAVLPHRPGLPAAGAARAQGRGRVGRLDRQARSRSRPTPVTPAGAWSDSWRHLGSASAQSDGRRVVRHGDGTGVRAVVRLLVHRFPGHSAGHGCRVHDRRPPHAPDRGHPENALSGARDPAGHDRHRAAPE